MSILQENFGLCYGCQQHIDAREMMLHLQKCCGSDLATKHKMHAQEEQIYLVHVESANIFWLYAEVKGNIKLENLYMFLRSNWYECCGHISPFIVEGKKVSEDYMQQTVADIFKIGDGFHYAHNGGIETKVVGKIMGLKLAIKQNQDLQIASRKVVEEERCATCIADTN